MYVMKLLTSCPAAFIPLEARLPSPESSEGCELDYLVNMHVFLGNATVHRSGFGGQAGRVHAACSAINY